MNKKQKEVQQLFLDQEKEVLKKLEANYEDALSEINSKIELLMARQDADMQHVIYQVEYQKALKDQVSAILEQLHNNEFDTVSEYLAQSYEDGFIGTMYDLQGQGIPLIIPLDQEQVVAAIQHETKLSESLYMALGKDTKVLSKKIAGEISRGISNAAMYSEIARNIAAWGRIPKNNAMRIARTEAHRIQIQATADAQWKAKANGADVVKQWDASLDKKTRKSHRELDGQIRELDEEFEVNGHKAMQPGGFGRPEEDINCRCALLQRARWALDNDYTKWDEDAPVEIADDGTSQLAYIKAKNYKDFKEQYKQASERVRENVQKMKPVNKNGEEIQFNLDGMSEEGQKYIKDKVTWLSSEYNTPLVEIQYDKNLKYIGGKVDSYTGTVMQIKAPHSIEHEFFHTFDSAKRLKYKGDFETNEEFWKEANKLFRDYKKVAINNRDIRISEYSLEDVDEFMAEAFGVAKGGIPADPFGVGSESPYTQKALSIIDKYFKKESVENIGKSSTIVSKKDASKYIGKTIVDKDNQSVREWYYANVHDIPNQIDKNKPFEEQVKQAYSLRNKYKHEARVAMSDRETAERLEKKRPAKSFDELLKDKMQRKRMTEEEALKDILETASKTNENVDKEFGL